MDFIKYLSFESIIFNFSTSLPTEIYDKVLLLKNIKYIDCYYMPSSILREFQKRRIKVDINFSGKLDNDFMLDLDAIDLDALYYKKSINIKKYDEKSIKNLKEFLKINANLKIIHLFVFENEILRNIIDALYSENIDGIIILLRHEYDKNNYIGNNFEFLKKLNNEYKMYSDGEIRIIYSNKFVKNNLFRQLTYNNLKLISILSLYVVIVGVFFIEFYKYISDYNLALLEEQLKSNISDAEGYESSIMITEDGSSTVIIIPPKETEVKYNFTKSFPALTKINKETVGWLTVNGTKINYPVVKHKDNEYYLKRDFFKARATSGWIFMDYRNSKDLTDANTIIYGHRMNNETMFGSLYHILEKSWYNNSENLIINFDTQKKEMKYKVFSIYKVKTTSDYLKTNFYSETEFNTFVKMLKKRSIKDFKVDLKYTDKIITLSTCVAGSQNHRLVLHAKLVY